MVLANKKNEIDISNSLTIKILSTFKVTEKTIKTIKGKLTLFQIFIFLSMVQTKLSSVYYWTFSVLITNVDYFTLLFYFSITANFLCFYPY